MNRGELVSAIAQRTGQTEKDVDSTLRGFFEVAAGVVAKGDEKITIPGFLSIEQSARSARTGRNPQTGETIQIAASKSVKISAGSKMKAIANGTEPAP